LRQGTSSTHVTENVMAGKKRPMAILSGINQKRIFRNILKSSRTRLYRMAYAWTHDPALADDLVQQTYYKALRNQRQLREIEAANAWLFRILANCLADHHRARRELLSSDELICIERRTPEHATRDDQLAQRVRQAVRSLPLAQCQVISLVDLEGFAYADVSQILDIPVGTVMSRLSRGRRALRERLLDLKTREVTASSPRMRRVK
jgi:RNA polymerase sigma-70 factor (ECF subfamily)